MRRRWCGNDCWVLITRLGAWVLLPSCGASILVMRKKADGFNYHEPHENTRYGT